MSWVFFTQILVVMCFAHFLAYVFAYVLMSAYLEKKVKLDIEKECTIRSMNE